MIFLFDRANSIMLRTLCRCEVYGWACTWFHRPSRQVRAGALSGLQARKGTGESLERIGSMMGLVMVMFDGSGTGVDADGGGDDDD